MHTCVFSQTRGSSCKLFSVGWQQNQTWMQLFIHRFPGPFLNRQIFGSIQRIDYFSNRPLVDTACTAVKIKVARVCFRRSTSVSMWLQKRRPRAPGPTSGCPPCVRQTEPVGHELFAPRTLTPARPPTQRLGVGLQDNISSEGLAGKGRTSERMGCQ